MTPEEKAVVQAAINAHGVGHLAQWHSQDTILRQAVHALIFACPECNAGGHTCPGDGESIGHGDSDCGRHSDTPPTVDPGVLDRLSSLPDFAGTLTNVKPVHAGADGECPNCAPLLAGVSVTRTDGTEPPTACYMCGWITDCVCSSTIKQYCASKICHGGADVLEWVPRTWRDVRRGDTVRLPGTEMTASIYTAVLLAWHVDPRTGTSGFNPPVPMEHAIMRVRFEHESFPRDMDPAKSVEIQLTVAEVAALDAAGWMNRAELITAEGETSS